MKVSFQEVVGTSACQLAAVAFVVSLIGCFASVDSVARDSFVHDHACPPDQVTYHSVEDSATRVEVIGCGHDYQYDCISGGQTVTRESIPTVCSERARFAFEATDGSLHEAWDWTSNERSAAARDAGIASAVHDLPCGRASTLAVDELTLEGCGQRITYRQVAREIATPPGHFGINNGSRYTLVGRVPIPGAATPSPAPSSAPASSGAVCAKDTDCKGDRVCVQAQCADPPTVKTATPPVMPPSPTVR
jgi:hypothetical protein